MDKVLGQISAAAHLYPPIDPFDQRMLDVGDGHRVYVEQCGNPNGIPALVLHGGPGGGCSPAMRRFFDPDRYRVVLFDQRGCGRSRPSGSVEANTTWHLVDDIELIRKTLGIDGWTLFGGSWGAALALIYAQTRPEKVRAMILRGIFLMTQPELDWFYGGGAGKFWPDQWRHFSSMVPPEEQDDLIGAYSKRLFGDDSLTATRFARAWTRWENALASFEADGSVGDSPVDFARVFARLENHYFANGGFLDDQSQILANMDKIAKIPGAIVQGRYDMICPPESAHRIARLWPAARLRMVPFAGHALSEPGICKELVAATDHCADIENNQGGLPDEGRN